MQKILILLVMLALTCPSLAEGLPTVKDVKERVDSFLTWREQSGIMKIDGAEYTWHSPGCYVNSQILGKILKDGGLTGLTLVRGWNHMFLSVETDEGELLIDSTYRQFYTNPWLSDKQNHDYFESTGMPKILVVLRENLIRELTLFKAKPSWDKFIMGLQVTPELIYGEIKRYEIFDDERKFMDRFIQDGIFKKTRGK